MRTILTPEQVEQVVDDVWTWIDRQVESLAEDQKQEKQEWRDAKLMSIEQLTEIEELECYHIWLNFKHEMMAYSMAYLLKRENDGFLHQIQGCTFFPPDFTHPSQETAS